MKGKQEREEKRREKLTRKGVYIFKLRDQHSNSRITEESKLNRNRRYSMVFILKMKPHKYKNLKENNNLVLVGVVKYFQVYSHSNSKGVSFSILLHSNE